MPNTPSLKKYLPAGIILLFFFIAYLLPLGIRPMLRPDEYRYAEIPREMISSENWVTPRIAGIDYFEKPGLGYQITALSFTIFGENAFALRLPSALAVLLTALFLFFFLKKMREEGDPDLLPELCCGIYLSFGLVYGIGTFAVLDSLLCCALTVTTGSFFLACRAKRRGEIIIDLLLAGAAAGAAFLVKGLLGFVIPAIICGAYLLWKREWKKLFLYPLLPLGAAIAVLLPWSVAIHQESPGFWPYFIKVEHWMRFTGRTFDRAPEPFWYFLPVLLVGIFPSALLLLPAKSGFEKKLFKRDVFFFAFLWFALPFLFFSASSCKLGTYILPCFPPLALLFGGIFLNAFKRNFETSQALFRRTLRITGIAIILLTLLTIPVWIILKGVYCFFPFFILLLLLWGGFLFFFSRKKNIPPLFYAFLFLFGWGAAVFPGLAALPPAVWGNKDASFCIRKLTEKHPVSQDDVILADRTTFIPAAWTLKKTDLILLGRPGEFLYPLMTSEKYKGRWYKDEKDRQLLERTPAGKRVFIGMRSLRKYPLPENWKVLEQDCFCGFIFVRF